MAFSNKRGQAIFDMIMVIIVLFILGLAAVVGGFIMSELNDEVQADNDISTTAKEASSSVNANYSTWFDNVFLTVLIFLWIMLIVTSFMIDAHPIFFIITVLLLIVVFIVGMGMANAYEELTTDADFSAYSANMTKTNFIFDNFLLVLIIMGLTAAASLYAKSNL